MQRASDKSGNSFGIAQCQLLGHQFADDERQIGNDGDDEPQRRLLGDDDDHGCQRDGVGEWLHG